MKKIIPLVLILLFFISGCSIIPSLPHKEIDESTRNKINAGVPEGMTRYVLCGGDFHSHFEGGGTFSNTIIGNFGPLTISSESFKTIINLNESAVIDIQTEQVVKIVDKKSGIEISSPLISRTGKINHVSINLSLYWRKPRDGLISLPTSKTGFDTFTTTVWDDLSSNLYTVFDDSASVCKSKPTVFYRLIISS